MSFSNFPALHKGNFCTFGFPTSRTNLGDGEVDHSKQGVEFSGDLQVQIPACVILKDEE